MRRAMAWVAAAVLVPGLAWGQTPTPAERTRLQQLGQRYLTDCPAGGTAGERRECEGTRSFFLLIFPDAVMGRAASQRKLAGLLAEGSTPPIRRDPVEACAWAMFAAAIAREQSPDGVTVPKDERDVYVRQCVRHGEARMQAGQRRAAALIPEMTEEMRKILVARQAAQSR